MPRIIEGFVRLEAFVEKIIAERRANPRTDGFEDLLTMLIEAGDSGNVAHRQLVDLIMFFFIAGYDTSKNVLTFTMKTLLDYPEIYARCTRSPSASARRSWPANMACGRSTAPGG